MFPAYYLMNSLLIILFLLHIVWTYYIVKILHRAVISGKVIISHFKYSRNVIIFSLTDRKGFA